MESKRPGNTPEQSSDFVASMERVLDVYKRPYEENNPTVCMDESPKQLIDDAREPLPMKQGVETRKLAEHGRNRIACTERAMPEQTYGNHGQS